MKRLLTAAAAATLVLAACSPTGDPTSSATSTAPTTTAPTTGYDSTDPFCLALADAVQASSDAESQMSRAMSTLTDSAAMASGDMTAINQIGATLTTMSEQEASAYEGALNAADDPAIREDLQFFIDFAHDVIGKMGEAASNATSFEDYAAQLSSITSDANTQRLMNDAESVATDLATYIQDRCGA